MISDLYYRRGFFEHESFKSDNKKGNDESKKK